MNEELEPITFSITDREDLMRHRDFHDKHYRTCRRRFPDVSGALLVYEVIPTSLGTLFVVKCPCGEELTLDGGMV